MDILQDYPQVQFMLALHEGVAVSMADAYARLDPAAGVRRGAHRARPGQRAGHDAQRAHRQDAAGGLRRPVAEQRAAPGAAPVGTAGRHGPADRQVGGAGRARARRAARAAARLQDRRRAAPGPGLPGAADGRAGRRSGDGHRADHLHELARAAGRRGPGGGRRPAGQGASGPCSWSATRSPWPTRRPRSTRVAELLGRADVRVLRLRVQRAGGPPAEPGQRRLRLAEDDSRDAGRLRRAVRRRRAGLPADLPRARSAGARPEHAAGPARLLHATSWARTCDRTSRCWATRRRAWPSWPS